MNPSILGSLTSALRIAVSITKPKMEKGGSRWGPRGSPQELLKRYIYLHFISHDVMESDGDGFRHGKSLIMMPFG